MKSNNEIKTVGVITMHRVINYGSFLQAYATQQLIIEMGYQCKIIDYLFPNEWHYNNGLTRSQGLKSFLSKYIYPLGLTKGHRKTKKINKAIKTHLLLTDFYKNPEELSLSPPDFDIYVTGSDQTWNPKHTKGDSSFLLSFVPAGKKKISFSASLAGKNINDEFRSVFESELPKYDSVAIRDENGNKVIEDILGRSASVTLDPTLMLNRRSWYDFAKSEGKYKSQKYIVFYLITHSFNPTPYIYELLKELQTNTGYKVYSFSKIPSKYEIHHEVCSTIGVEEFIQLYMGASFVVTSSFHGTAFAVNFGVPLYSVIKNDNFADDRQASLLKKLDIENCLVPIGTKFEEINPKYDIDKQQEKLEELRSDSKNYLFGSLKEK